MILFISLGDARQTIYSKASPSGSRESVEHHPEGLFYFKEINMKHFVASLLFVTVIYVGDYGKFRFNESILSADKITVEYCGMVSEGVFSVIKNYKDGWPPGSACLYYPSSAKYIKTVYGNLKVVEVTPEYLKLEMNESK